MTQNENSSETHINLPNLEPNVAYLTMPTRSQRVGIGDPPLGHDAYHKSDTNQIRMIRKQNAILEQVIERPAERET